MVGTLVFLVGDLKLESQRNKIVLDAPKLKNKLQKQQQPLKIFAKIADIKNIERNEVSVKICKRPRNGMISNEEHRILFDYLAIAKRPDGRVL